MTMTLEALIRAGRKHEASDVHIVVGMPPVFRVDGQMVTAKGEAMTPDVVRNLVYGELNDSQKKKLEETWQLCFTARYNDGERARVTVYYRNGAPELAIRMTESDVRSRDQLRLPEIVDDLIRKPNGLIIVTGPTGVGKTTTLNYMIDRINSEFRKKVITVEDPIEYTHTSKRAVVVQQELLTDVHSFDQALIHILRQDPDVICIGEMRDPDTIYTALVAAETGHLVIATLHTPNTVQATQRIVAAFNEGQQSEIRYMLANSIQAIIAQQLLSHAQGGRRILACELLIGTQGVRNNIRENNLHKLYTELQAGRKYGMITMDHALLELYQQGEISYDTALAMAHDPETIKARSA